MELDPNKLTQSDRYKLMIGCIVPRPIAFVSTVSRDGSDNLAPFSFFTGVGATPMTLLFCPTNKRDGTPKDTLRNADPETGTGQFVVSAAASSYIRKVAAAAEPVPYGESEFDLTGLTRSPSTAVRPPRIAESPCAFECETERVIRLAPGEPGGANVVIGRIVHVFVRDGLADDRLRIDPDALAAVGRLGGLAYCTTRERAEIPMGIPALCAEIDPAFLSRR